jgi:sulfite reductase beta subunit-like hemoprotein
MPVFNTKQDIINGLRNQITVKDSTAIHTLLFIYNRQIDDELKRDCVKYRNGIGFKPQDAKLGSSLAKWYNDKGFLTPKQMLAVKSLIVKYARQVIEYKISSNEIIKENNKWIWK